MTFKESAYIEARNAHSHDGAGSNTLVSGERPGGSMRWIWAGSQTVTFVFPAKANLSHDGP